MQRINRYFSFVFILINVGVFGQEIDDMYFNSKDRAKINERKISSDLGLVKKGNEKISHNLPVNPTDSYSARNINPEYTAQLNPDSKSSAVSTFFTPDFQPTGVNQNITGCGCNSNLYSGINSGYNSMYSPYYGSGFGSPYGYYPSSMGYPYGGFNSGLSLSMGYGWGSSPGYYGGMGYGMGSYMNPYYNPWYNNYWGGSYYPGTIVYVTDGSNSNITHSKRTSRSSNLNNGINYSRPTTTAVAGTGYSRTNVSGGRSSSPEYYDRAWKRNQETSPTRGYWSTNNNTGTRSDINWGGNSGGRQGTSGYTSPSRNSFNNSGSYSGGSRSGSSGSSGTSGTRGRNN
ncbi:MAG: hypothetical protein OEU76_05890 [Cyclobacteriaceae bacterium]|nr:hypothetical protein [Cyclobacteriaceae bacterium]